MANCINKSSKEFIKLAIEAGTKPESFAADVAIWQETNNTDSFPTIEELYPNKEHKAEFNENLEALREINLSLENDFEKVFSKNAYSESPDHTTKYLDFMDSGKEDSVVTTEQKIEAMQKAFDSIVLVDTQMKSSGKLLAANNPISKRNGGKPVIVINPNLLFSDTVFHEYGHLYIDLLGGMSDPLIQDAVEFLKDSSLWFRVQDEYPELNAEGLAKEVVATALGIEGAMMYDQNPEAASIWNRIKAAILNAINTLFGNKQDLNALERLASEMLNNKTRVTSTATFNTLVDQHQKFKLKSVTQDNIDKLFKEFTNTIRLVDEVGEDRFYENDNDPGSKFTKSVSTIAKSFNVNPFATRKGDIELQFDKGFELTEDNFGAILKGSSIPQALDMAMGEFFRAELIGDDVSDIPSPIDGGEYWNNKYLQMATDTEALELGVNPDRFIKDSIKAINERAHEIQEKLTLPLQAGNEVHNAIESYVIAKLKGNEIPFPSHLLDPSGKLKKAIDKIVDNGIKNGSKFYTEQMLFSQISGTPGTADLIEITKDGKHRIYDFKTMDSFYDTRTGQLKTNYQMYTSKGYINQLIIYSTMLKEYGIEPADNHLNILAIEINKDDMVSGELTSEIGIEDVTLGNILELAKTDTSLSNAIIKANNNIVGYFQSANRFSTDTELDSKTSEIDQLAQRIERAVTDFNAKNPNELGETRNIKKLADDIQLLMGKENEAMVLTYVENMRKTLTRVYASSTSKAYLSPKYLQDLEMLTQLASFLPNVRNFLLDQHADYQIEGNSLKKLMTLLNETEENLNQVLKFQDYAVKEKAVEVLASNSNFMEGLWAEKFEMEARKKNKRNKEDIKAYVYENLKKNKDKIQREEYKYWQRQFKNGYTDIRYMEYLLADPGMNKSQFVQVAKNVMDKADMAIRIDLDRSIADLTEWHKNLDIETTGDPAKVWGKFVEDSVYIDPETGEEVTFKNATLIPEFTSKRRELMMRYQFLSDAYERKIIKASKDGDTKRVEKLIEMRKKIRDQKIAALKKSRKNKEDKKVYTHPAFKNLTDKEKEALRYMHNKLEEADKRLASRQSAKLVKKWDGLKIYNLPKTRKSKIEAMYDTNGLIKRYKSGINEWFAPAADEDELSLTDSEAGKDEFGAFNTSSTDIVGDTLYEIPVYYRRQLDDPTLQSLDLPTMLAMNEETTIQYEHFSMIEPDLHMITGALKTTQAHKTDQLVNNKVLDKLEGGLSKTLNSEGKLVQKAVRASINNRLYKRSYGGTYSKLNYRLIKAGESIGKYTSSLLLAGNFGSASMTGLQGSVYRLIEGAAGEDFSSKDVAAGSRKAWADVSNMLQDTQRQFPQSKSALLIRRFGLETQYKALVNKFVQDNFATKAMDEGSIFAVTTMAETIVTASLMYTLMNNIKVMNDSGDFINQDGKKVSTKDAMSLDEAYDVVDGKLVLNEHVAFTEFNLTNRLIDNISGEKTVAATEISNYIRSKYADLYGQYNQDMKSVAEMHIAGKLAFSMKKWVPRGYHRRWRGITSFKNTFEEMRKEDNIEKRFYSQDQKKFQEGYYTTGLRYMYTLRKEMKKHQLKIAMANVKSTMSTHERANIMRLAYEFATMLFTFGSALALRALASTLDDDDRYNDKIYFVAYLMERLKTETATFINPLELINLLENPAASINTFKRVGDLIEQLVGFTYEEETGLDWEINNRFEKGSRKGNLQIGRDITSLIPFYKKVQQFGGILGWNTNESIEDSFKWMIR